MDRTHYLFDLNNLILKDEEWIITLQIQVYKVKKVTSWLAYYCKCIYLKSRYTRSSIYCRIYLPGRPIAKLCQNSAFAQFSAAIAHHYTSAIFAPPVTHHCWVDKGNMKWEVFPTLLLMTNSENQTMDLLILSPWVSASWFKHILLVNTKGSASSHARTCDVLSPVGHAWFDLGVMWP